MATLVCTGHWCLQVWFKPMGRTRQVINAVNVAHGAHALDRATAKLPALDMHHDKLQELPLGPARWAVLLFAMLNVSVGAAA